MPISTLRALHTLIGTALDEIERVFDEANVNAPLDGQIPSPPPSPRGTSSHRALDFPDLDSPHDPASESLTTDDRVVAASNIIVAACGQLGASVRDPFLSLCDASMAYSLPACIRLFEATHLAEILRDSPLKGLHVDVLSEKTGVETGKLAHILRLLATHHFVTETSPNVFATNRITRMLDTGVNWESLRDDPQSKYTSTTPNPLHQGISALIGCSSDELFKAGAYLTESFLLIPSKRLSREPKDAPFGVAFQTENGFFGWLEDQTDAKRVAPKNKRSQEDSVVDVRMSNSFRLARFGKAMTGTGSLGTHAILRSFDWNSLADGSVIVDVGGGIGSTTMVLAEAFSNLNDRSDFTASRRFKYVVQDRGVVVSMGEKAWRERSPEMLDTGLVKFQEHDFFRPQPTENEKASVFILRVILHDWPAEYALRILLRLREAAVLDGANGEMGTRLIVGDHIMPLACAEESNNAKDIDMSDAPPIDAPWPLIANLGKASANAYWMDMTMQAIFNAEERTLRELDELLARAGWKVVKVTRAVSQTQFGFIVAKAVDIPAETLQRMSTVHGEDAVRAEMKAMKNPTDEDILAGMTSRSGTPTFGSHTKLPGRGSRPTWNSQRGGRGSMKPRFNGRTSLRSTSSTPTPLVVPAPVTPKQTLARRQSHASLRSSPNPPPLLVNSNAGKKISRRQSYASIASVGQQSSSHSPPQTPLSPMFKRTSQPKAPKIGTPTNLIHSSPIVHNNTATPRSHKQLSLNVNPHSPANMRLQAAFNDRGLHTNNAFVAESTGLMESPKIEIGGGRNRGSKF